MCWNLRKQNSELRILYLAKKKFQKQRQKDFWNKSQKNLLPVSSTRTVKETPLAEGMIASKAWVSAKEMKNNGNDDISEDKIISLYFLLAFY